VKPGLAARFKQACRWGLLLALGVAYAALSHRMAASDTPTVLGALVAIVPLVGLALVMAWRSARRTLMLTMFGAACLLLYGASNWLLAHYHWVFFLEHAGTNTLLCTAFGGTLQAGHIPMITRFARIVHGELSPAQIRYTRTATWAWAVYFGCIAALSLLLFWLAPAPVWAVFAYLLGIPLLVLMFVGEYAVRCYALPAKERAGPLESLRAYRQASADGSVRLP
jgi:uncharacterized membrane protein